MEKLNLIKNLCPRRRAYYLPGDFIKARKSDAHIHYNTLNDTVLKYAESINMHLLTINVETAMPIEKQLDIAVSLGKEHPGTIDFVGTFDSSGFESDHFAEEAIEQVKKCMDAGARGIKIWKNIGMVLKNKDEKYVMADDPVFAPIFEYLEKEGITLLTHLAEPRNCWLPYEEITTEGDLRYYKHHPQYHMYQHPEVPSYEEQIIARDHLLEQYPDMKFVGAHIGSLEWNVDEVAERFDKYPQFYVDLSARMSHLQLQAFQDWKKIRDFFIKYQDRLIYGLDWTVSETSRSKLATIFRFFLPGIYRKIVCRALHESWENHWLFLASDRAVKAERFNLPDIPKTIKGLHLPKKVVDKVFYENAMKVYNITGL
ncbi:MAG: amidohydrolase [Bacteroidales bacterium]|jgi:predicted TIM-barrel fold metal-dependent hydrolase|nr:amidohydrolase [Bacteroidales bacterium]